MNKENFKRVLDLIKNNPELWHQAHYHCGTAHCFAGHAQILSGKPENTRTARSDAREWLDLTKYEADYLFHCRATIECFEKFLADGICNMDNYYRYL